MKRKNNTKLMPYISKQYDCLWDDNFELSSNIYDFHDLLKNKNLV